MRLIIITFLILKSFHLIAQTFDVTFAEEAISITDNLSDKEIFLASCEEINKKPEGNVYRCEDVQFNRQNIVIKNIKDQKLIIIAFIKTLNEKTKSTIVCSLDENEKNSDCHLANPRKNGERSGMISPFKSQVENLNLPNAAWVAMPDRQDNLGGLLRGMNPQIENDFYEITNLGIEKILIFKDFSDASEKDLAKEIEAFKKLGVNKIKHFPFPYYDFESYSEACVMTIAALEYLHDARSNNQSVYFHCTVGEDRTGYLSTLYLLANNSQLSIEEALENIMCEHGYEGGNPFKPFIVKQNIQKDLTALYSFMAKYVHGKYEKSEKINDKKCALADLMVKKSNLRCKTSTKIYVQ